MVLEEVIAKVEAMAAEEVKAVDARVFYAVAFPRREPPQRPGAARRGSGAAGPVTWKGGAQCPRTGGPRSEQG